MVTIEKSSENIKTQSNTCLQLNTSIENNNNENFKNIQIESDIDIKNTDSLENAPFTIDENIEISDVENNQYEDLDEDMEISNIENNQYEDLSETRNEILNIFMNNEIDQYEEKAITWVETYPVISHPHDFFHVLVSTDKRRQLIFTGLEINT
ncbi:2205_t:CDS:2 [Scutellospora calospora]|uniref:2205_t:CDS:1 n=1 Tax=Scutellospora calospora TaxID=85575 RepID=A0ACA9K5F2_9GLOM|nr:2205_t:CDS:2 [Scutellospora calospora]